MIKVTFIEHDGTETTAEGDHGDSVMSLAVAQGVDGIVAECGGGMMCATCHCYVDDAWFGKTGPRSEGEEDMLESAVTEVKPTSRLSCQITLSDDLDGLVVRLPEVQV
ncbi:2Fe-2S iron-sulfur cluster-binding protein [Aquicoccus porphyridii]|uniref:(2Fe-2S)-binding protein n=1 Tax=Aquicoccus porphyridii TaxID=1852029 RepID=A0A5A9YYV2_9RHOB|nr:2Fe-2S iron-sulfur cluster-binding protein [Aquicoccus porphyridii]KAA0910007.1 (2Fe-2S)-binding protein [Aquicoccus porphyridii]RAI52125.1 (2Fe-2S)-binding protein [Rhodobacteraceae bacterium AsT-22]